jgi:hypothetical protein
MDHISDRNVCNVIVQGIGRKTACNTPHRERKLAFRAVRVDGVRSAEPPNISGSTDASALSTSSERFLVAAALVS